MEDEILAMRFELRVALGTVVACPSLGAREDANPMLGKYLDDRLAGP